MKLDPVFSKLLQGQSLTAKESATVFTSLFSGEVDLGQAKRVLLLLAKKGETADEVTGCLQALRKSEKPVQTNIKGLIDTCGTGGDQRHSLNISTLAAIVAAGAGCKVAKHGNRAMTSKCGSSDLLKEFGFNLNASLEKMIESIRVNNIGYFHAPNHHPAFSRFQEIRRQLKVKTIFNLLGPLANPLRLDGQLIGVSKPEIRDFYVKVLKKLKAKRALVVFSDRDGLDEISCSEPTTSYFVNNGRVKKIVIDPKKLGLEKIDEAKLKVISPQESREISEKILTGKDTGPVVGIILINAAYAIWIAGKAKSIKQALLLARNSIKSGNANRALQGLVKSSNL